MGLRKLYVQGGCGGGRQQSIHDGGNSDGSVHRPVSLDTRARAFDLSIKFGVKGANKTSKNIRGLVAVSN